MNGEEIKSRNIALATYMGWVYNEEEGCWQFADGTGWLAPPNPPFNEDMNLLMPVVWKLMGYCFEFRHYKVADGYWVQEWVGEDKVKEYRAGSPALALWEAVSSLVMELQQKAV